MLVEILEKQISKLLAELDSNDYQVTKDFIVELEKFSSSVIENEDLLVNYETDQYVDAVYDKQENVNIEKYKNDLKTLKKLVNAKLNSDADIREFFELSDEQKEFIKNICSDTQKFIEKLKDKIKNNDIIFSDIDIYQGIVNKIKSNKRIELEDFEVISSMISGDDPMIQFKILKDLLHYNLSVEKENLNINYFATNSVSAEDIIAKLKEYEPIIEKQEQYENVVNDYHQEISTEINFGVCDEIIKFFKEKGIFYKFKSPSNLLAILVYGDIDSVRAAYDDLSSRDLLMKGFVYEFPSLWTAQEYVERKKLNRVIPVKDGPSGKETLISKTRELYRNELYEKIAFYKENDIDLLSDKPDCLSALKPTLHKIKRVMNNFNKYNIRPELSCFILPDAEERFDRLIECNLLNPDFDYDVDHDLDDWKRAYVNKFSTFIGSVQEKHILLIQKILEENNIYNENYVEDPFRPTFDSIFSKYYEFPQLSGEFRHKFLGEFSYISSDKTTSRIENFMKRYDMIITNSSNMDRYNQMEQITKTTEDLEDYNDREDVINDPFIVKLDEKYKVDSSKHVYMINGLIISRFKVLRLYGILKDFNAFSENEKFNEDDIKLFAVTYGKYFKTDSYEKIKNEILALERGVQR